CRLLQWSYTLFHYVRGERVAFPDVTVKLIHHVYWHRKVAFMLEEDEYPCWTIFAVEDGRFHYRVGEQKGEAKFGDFVICPPNTVFKRKTLEPLSFHFLQFVWLSEPNVDDKAVWIGKLTINDTERLSSNYRYLRELLGWEEESALHKQHMVNDLIRLVKMERDHKEDPSTEVDLLMEKARSYITKFAYGSLSLLDLAVSLELTPVQFTRKFRKAFGQTPSEFLNVMRLTRARHLLEGSTLTLDAIAEKCGFENGFYLSRVFTQKMGIAPSIYRNRHRV
ncbi:helix-turn-helix domain-containing protein, partial [Paenibacillus sp. TAF58]